MTAVLADHLAALVDLCTKNCQDRGERLVTASEAASRLLMLWLQHLIDARLTGTSDSLVQGMLSAVREGTACLALGLVRPALTSLRLQVDLGLSWLYFKDHPVEWSRVQETGDGFKLKTELLKYLAEHHPRFKDRMGILRDCKTRTQDDPYRLLSAHIHAQNEPAIPQVEKPSDIVASAHLQDEFVQLQAECAEYMNDVFWSMYAERWATIGEELRSSINARFKTPAQRAEFFQT